MRLVFDAGALIGVERAERRVAGLIELGRRAAAGLVTTAPVVGQAWRGGAKQARLARALAMIDVQPVTLEEAKDAGELLARAHASDAVDALVVMLAVPGDQILTSDPDDISRLVRARRIKASVVTV